MFKCEVLKRLDALERQMDRVIALFSSIIERQKIMSQELDNLTAQVKQTTDLETSAVTLIQGLADQIKAARDDPAKLDALTAELKSKADALAAAITSNTPASGGGGGTSPPAAAQHRHKP